MTKVLIDGDIISYRAAFATQDKSKAAGNRKADELINYIWEKTIDVPFPSESDFHVYLTGRTNFRFDVAKAAPYKGNRKGEKPRNLESIRDHILTTYPSSVSQGEEADDAIAIDATEIGPDAIIASIDKDFLQVPCKHYNFVKDEWATVEEFEGLKFFYTQVLTGDAVDNIVGLFRVGPVKAKKMLEGCDSEQELYDACINAYDGDVDRVLENARLLWLRRYEGEMWTPPDG